MHSNKSGFPRALSCALFRVRRTRLAQSVRCSPVTVNLEQNKMPTPPSIQSVRPAKRLQSSRRPWRSVPRLAELAVFMFVAAGLVGCATTNHIEGRPVRFGYFVDEKGDFDERKYKDFIASINVMATIQDFEDDQSTSADRKKLRNELASKLLVAYDENYGRFLNDLTAYKKRIDAGGDIIATSLSIAATVVSPVSTTNVLAGLAGGVTASKVAFNKAYFYEQTLPVIINQMNADRQAILSQVLPKLEQSVEVYDLNAMIRDMDLYYYAGTIEGALVNIQEEASRKSKEAKENVKQYTEARIKAAVASYQEVFLKLKDNSKAIQYAKTQVIGRLKLAEHADPSLVNDLAFSVYSDTNQSFADPVLKHGFVAMKPPFAIKQSAADATGITLAQWVQKLPDTDGDPDLNDTADVLARLYTRFGDLPPVPDFQ